MSVPIGESGGSGTPGVVIPKFNQYVSKLSLILISRYGDGRRNDGAGALLAPLQSPQRFLNCTRLEPGQGGIQSHPP
eukprot:3045763-Karenia_brevis.AAC.1